MTKKTVKDLEQDHNKLKEEFSNLKKQFDDLSGKYETLHVRRMRVSDLTNVRTHFVLNWI